jgi:hypothetical protein
MARIAARHRGHVLLPAGTTTQGTLYYAAVVHVFVPTQLLAKQARHSTNSGPQILPVKMGLP